jgi:hypothetical protein
LTSRFVKGPTSMVASSRSSNAWTWGSKILKVEISNSKVCRYSSRPAMDAFNARYRPGFALQSQGST